MMNVNPLLARSHGTKGAKAMQQGLYFRKTTMEITTIRGDDESLPGADWEFVAETLDAGLVGARTLLVERGLVPQGDAGRVYWLMPSPAHRAAAAARQAGPAAGAAPA